MANLTRRVTSTASSDSNRAVTSNCTYWFGFVNLIVEGVTSSRAILAFSGKVSGVRASSALVTAVA
jgi:hypothetical protein